MFRRAFLAAALSLLAATASGLAGPAGAAEGTEGQPTFRIGVAPHTSARVIIEQYQPIRQTVEAALGRPAEIQTAPDFTEFARRAVAQNYDIAITTGHQARLLETDAGYLPLVTYAAPFTSVVVVPLDSPARQAHDLDRATVIGLSPSSLVTLWGEHWLRENKVAGTQIRYVSAADSVAQLVLAGDASAGFMSSANFQGLAAETRARLRFLAQSEPMAGRVYMLNARHAADRQKLVEALQAFSHGPEGRRYFDATKLEGYRTVHPNELAVMDPYAAEVRRNLQEQAQEQAK